MTVQELTRKQTGELEWLDSGRTSSHRSFRSWDAWVKHCDTTPHTLNKTKKVGDREVPVVPTSRKNSAEHGSEYGKRWAGTKDWKQAVKWATEGSDDGVEEMRRYIRYFSRALGGMIKLPEYNYDVMGHDYDVAAVVEGRPEAWLQPEDTYLDGISPDTVEIWYNPEYSGYIDVAAISKRGAVACALASLLEQANIPTRLVITYGTIARGHRHTADVTLKDYMQPLELRRFGFAVANAASCRRFSFADCETLPRDHRRKLGVDDDGTGGYGSPCNHERIPKNAVVFHHMSWSEENDWNDPEFTKQWILDKLKEKGVALIEGALVR